MPSRRRSYSRTPSRDSRSASPDVGRSREDRRSHREDRDRISKPLPLGAAEIDDEDYFLKNAEFRAWLKDTKSRYFDELSSERARKYFHKFVKAWNRGKLPDSFYVGLEAQPASSQTAYKWSFAERGDRTERAALEEARRTVGTATKGQARKTEGASTTELAPQEIKKGKVHGPSLPSSSDRILMLEAQEEERMARQIYNRKRGRQDEKDRMEDMVGPKEQGREGMLEKKKVRREADRSAKDAKDDAFGEYDESTLMGGGDSFQARISQRDAARKRFDEKRTQGREDKDGSLRERRDAIRAKDSATMDMLKQLAKERFGA